MAIKDFIIGPQNYWEEGYFDGDYTHPNVAKFYLQCDIDNVKGGRIVTGEYFLDNYIDGTYYHKNAIEAGLTATADKIRNAQVQATGYFVEGYYATGYVEQGIASVLNATASVLFGTSAAISAQASTSTQAAKQVDVATSMAVVFSQTAIGSRTSDIDLYAFSQGGLTSDVNAIRAYELDALSSFDIATDYIRQRNTSSDAAAELSHTIAFERNRDTASATQVAFSFGVNETLFKEFNSTLQSQASISVAVEIFREVGSTLSAQSQITCLISHIHGADIHAFDDAEVVVTPEITRDYQAIASSVISLSADANRTRESLTLIVFNFASVIALPFITAKASSDVSSTLSSTATAVKTTESLASLASPFDNINVPGERIRYQDSSINVSTSVVTDNSRTRDNDSQIQSTATVSAVIGKLEDIDLYAFSNGILTTDAVVLRNVVINSQSTFTSSTNVGKIPPIEATLADTISLYADNVRIRFADSTITASGGVLSVVDVIPAVEAHMVGSFTTNRPYVDSGYVDDDYATNFVTVANYIVDNLHQLSIVSSMSIDAEFSVNGAALIASAGTLQSTAVKNTSPSSVQNVNANITADGSKFVGFESSVSLTFSIEAKVGSQEDVFVSLFDNVSLTSAVSKSVSATSTNSIVSTFYADTQNSLTTQAEASVASSFTQQSDTDRIRDYNISLEAFAFQVSVAVAERLLDAEFNSAFEINVVPTVLKSSAEAELDTETNLSAELDGVIEGNIAISSAMSFVAGIREIRLDDIVYVIPAEGWTYTIAGEGRAYDINGESRLRKITAESRLRRINGESRIYNIE